MAGKKTVLIIDGGGRGAALVHKYSLSRHVGKLLAIPGNELMQLNSKKPVKISPHLKTTDVFEILEIAKKEKVDLADVSQDNAIEAGLVDKLQEEGIATVGPTRLAGQIEWDKGWARDFMKKYKIPTPGYKVFDSRKEARDFINKNPNKKFFIKATGLAEGKGAIPAENKKQAFSAIDSMSKFGRAGKKFVIEDWLDGEEFSAFAISDGKSFPMIGFAQDHKRAYDGDLGPNTGGMGCASPPLVVNKNTYKQAEGIIKKTTDGLNQEGRPYQGILYLGAIVVGRKVFVIEFNSRWGDPEAEVIVPGIKNDFFELSMAVVNQKLNKIKIKTDKKSRIVVTASLRPGIETRKRRLFGIAEVLKIEGVTIYGTRVSFEKNKYFVSSGRLFHVVGEGNTISQARQKVYSAMSLLYIEGNNLHYRTDIGWRDVERIHQ